MAGGQLAGLLRIHAGLAQGLAGHDLIDARQHNQQGRTCRGKDPQPGIEHEDHKQVDRKPRRIKKRKQGRAGDELTNQRQIA